MRAIIHFEQFVCGIAVLVIVIILVCKAKRGDF